MNSRYPKISIIVICYNQEDVIKRALDSVIIQKDFLYELIISDDHSTDQTWDIIIEYQKKYPDIIKAYRQNQNVGVYENLQSTYDKVTGEVIFFLAGDDEFGHELFKETCETLSKSNLDFRNDKFCVITNYMVLKPNGRKVIITQNSLINKHNPLSLKIRGLIVNRALGESIATFNERKGIYIKKNTESKIPSSLQEGFADTIPFSIANTFFYLPIIGNIYYASIGVSIEISNHKEQRLKDQIEYFKEISNYIKGFNRNDLFWLRFQEVKVEFVNTLSTYKLLLYFYYLMLTPKDVFWKYYFANEYKFFLKRLLIFAKNKLGLKC